MRKPASVHTKRYLGLVAVVAVVPFRIVIAIAVLPRRT